MQIYLIILALLSLQYICAQGKGLRDPLRARAGRVPLRPRNLPAGPAGHPGVALARLARREL
tara:strand:- start:270 stop:455 length:186 start_codon:yes stop_codon:yes gene_type:complete